MCGIVGIVGVEPVNQRIYDALTVLQHRGQDAAGIMTAHQGELFMREKIAEVMAEEAIHAHPDDIVVSCGSQQALDLVTRVFCDPGDVVLAEAPSYVGALGT